MTIYYTIHQILECIIAAHISAEGKNVTTAKLLGIPNEKNINDIKINQISKNPSNSPDLFWERVSE